MIILLYLIVILGWALLIMIIKCRKAREKRIALAQQEAAQAQNAIHVIQIGNTVFDLIPITNSSSSSTSRCQHHTHCRRAYRMRHSSSSLSLNSNAHTNPTFVLDEGVFPSAQLTGPEAPPSYDEVIRLPNQYPKVSSQPSGDEESPPPPQYSPIHDLEASSESIATITSASPALITSSSSQQQQINRNFLQNRHIPIT